MARLLGLREEIERLPLGRQHVLIVVILALATLFDGYDVFAPAYVIPYAMKAWRLLPSQAGLLVSSGLLGFLVGSLVNGGLADRFGRRPVLVGSLLLAAAGNLATAMWAATYAQFLASRLLTGLGLGMILPISVTLINEAAPRRTANVLVGWMMAGWSIGGVAAALAGYALAPSHGWGALFAVGALAAPLAVLASAVLPESARFLAIRGRQRDVRAVMSRLAGSGPERYAQVEFTIFEDTGHRGSFRRLLTRGARGGTFVVWTCSGLSLFSIFGLSSWTPQLMLERGSAIGASFALSGLLQFAAVLGGIGCGWVADRAGRDRTLRVTWIVAAAAVAGLALLRSHAADVLLLSIAGFCAMGAQPVLNNRTAALYDTEIRSTGVGAQLGVGRVGGFLGPYVGGWIQQLFPGSAALFLGVASALVGCALCIRLLEGEVVPVRGQITRLGPPG
jgi:MFS transporter, AAHS family, 4-hydroxybenzoate transporter